ncbi:hypothetical protein ILP97_17250 [Amycolatopsis sp. H6(2020)]|nr:hypothetical protein [Amycolatopsis sp. H6(2020)]
MTAASPIPKALPGAPRLFVNRSAEVEQVGREITDGIASGRQAVVVLTGLPGVGKTTLAAQCADQVKDLFRDGWLWASLGSSSEAVSVDDVLFLFLTQLGVESPPGTSQGLRLAFQSATADKALLLVLDDVESAAQLVKLLPTSSRSVVLATSRRRSAGFIRERFTVVDVMPFSVASAIELISADLDSARVASAGTAIEALAELCGLLPLALSIAGAQLSTRHRGPVSDYVHQLRAARSVIEKFTVDGDRLVSAVFEVSYRDLSADERRAYRLLSLHPGRRFSADAAAALLGPEQPDPLEALEALVVANLLSRVGVDRYEFHSLVWEHAAGLVAEDELDDCRAAVVRVVEWYLRFAVAREQSISDRPRFGEYFDGRVVPAYRGGHAWQQAVEDLELERANLRRVVQTAVEEGLHSLAWQLCEAVVTFYFQRDLFADAIAVHSFGLTSAGAVLRETGDARPLLRMHTELGTAYFSSRDDRLASEQFTAAAALAEGLPGDDAVVFTRAKMFQWKSFVDQRMGAFPAAVEAIEAARSLVKDPRFPEKDLGRELALLDLNGAPMLSAVGRHDDALAAGHRAVAFFAGGKEWHNIAKAAANLGESLFRAGAGHRDEAERVLRQAVGLLADFGMQSWEAHSSTVLADLLEAAGRGAEAASLLQRAAELYTILEDRRAEALRDRLGEH